MIAFYQNKILLNRIVLQCLLLLLFIMGSRNTVSAQCPPNIDFEYGDFTGWQCYLGDFTNGNLVLNLSAPTPNRHTMLSTIPGDGLDPYGLFPRNCPNGSGHSIQLGNSSAVHQAEAISYTFTIPPAQNTFSLIYNYAMVLNDGGHAANIQPRLVIAVDNITDGTPLPCPLDPFIVNGSLPGFFTSATSGPGGSIVRCKNWTTSSVKLDGLAGKTIRIMFTTTDCGATQHFGYAYIDIYSQCSSSFVGATFCPDDTAINVTAPFGYQNYTWYDNSLTTILGTSQVLHLSPPPLSGSFVKVIVDPYVGYGCRDTLTAHLLDTLTIQPYAGKDTLICSGGNHPVQLGGPPLLGLVYKWVPSTGLNDSTIANPIATVSTTTQYVLTVTHDGGGCATNDTVNINVVNYDTTLQVIGPVSYCSSGGQHDTLKVSAGADSVQWYLNGNPIPGANQVRYHVTQSGAYYATLFSNLGCSFNTRVQQIGIYQSPVAGFNHNNTDQCFTNNQYVFTNTSSPPSGTPVYTWNMGDGTILTTPDITYSYTLPGTYLVKMTISGDGGCADSSSVTLHVFASPKAGFKVNTASQCFKNNQFVFTDTSSVYSGTLLYTWNLGDGTITNSRNVTHSYAIPGAYTVTLLTDAGAGCTDQASYNVTVYPSPVAGFSVNTANQCNAGNQFVFTNSSTVFSGPLQYTWNLGDGTTANTTDITHSYAKAGTFAVKLLVSTPDGCADSSSFNVTVYPNPTADFSVQPICINLPVPVINRTINNTSSTLNYLWDFGNGQSSTAHSPVYSYPVPGTYTIKLSVNSAQCPSPSDTKQLDIVVDAPPPGISYPAKDAVILFPEPLQARNIGASALWIPAVSLDNRNSYTPFFDGKDPQLYTVQLKTISGCITTDTQYVKTHKKIEIYVPTAFTPGTNGLNNYLRPLLMGFDKVNYFRIYNRWGKLLFEMKSDRPGWDGRSGGNPQEMQTVVWMIEAVDVDGVTHHRSGTTILMR